MPSKVSLKQMLEMGVHFGHRTQKWNPKMQPYIFMQRNGIHIIDLRQTITNMNAYYDMIAKLVHGGGTVMFVGTKRQAQETIAQEASRCGMPYVTERWLGGTLTNWRTIRARIDTLKKLEGMRDRGDLQLMTKREALMINREIEKLQLRLGGIREMKRLPDLMIVVDTFREQTAVNEANILNIPVLAMVDTNSNPDQIDYLLPANDDAMRSIKLVIGELADAVLEGKAMRKSDDETFDEGSVDEMSASYDQYDEDDNEDGADDARYLGKSTLAKLRDSKLFDDDDEDGDE